MKEYSIGITTNAWNALRYFLFTLVLVPAAEKLWALAHSRRTAGRVLDGQPARLRQSRLAYWGLHQEIDEASRLSRISVIVVCVLHIAGALILEYGSGSKETYVTKNAVLSRSLREENGLRENGVYFIDAGNILGKPFGATECIDGEPKKLLDFALRLGEASVSKTVSLRDIAIPSGTAHLKAEYLIPNSYWIFQMYDNGNARWYGQSSKVAWNTTSDRFTGFVNDTLTCRSSSSPFFECFDNEGKVDHANFLSEVLAEAAMPESLHPKKFLLSRNRTLNLVLSSVFVRWGSNQSRKPEADAQTGWIRRGMPRQEIPRETRLALHMKMNLLQDGCKHKHAIPASVLHKLENLKVVEQAVPNTIHLLHGNHQPLVWILGNSTALGTFTQAEKEHCCVLSITRVCVTKIARTKHEIAVFRWLKASGRIDYYIMMYNYSVHGLLRKMDALDLAVQANLQIVQRDLFTGDASFEISRQRVRKVIESGNALSGLIRVAGEVKQGKAALYKSDIATINILGFLGISILILLAAVPTTILPFYRQCVAADIESSYRRSVLEIHDEKNYLEVPDRTPNITRREVRGNNNWAFQHTYR